MDLPWPCVEDCLCKLNNSYWAVKKVTFKIIRKEKYNTHTCFNNISITWKCIHDFTVNLLLSPPGVGGGIEFPIGSETWSYFQFFSARTHFLPKTFPRIIRVIRLVTRRSLTSHFSWSSRSTWSNKFLDIFRFFLARTDIISVLDLPRNSPSHHRRFRWDKHLFPTYRGTWSKSRETPVHREPRFFPSQ